MSSQELSVCPESTVKYRLGFRLSLALFSRPPQSIERVQKRIFQFLTAVKVLTAVAWANTDGSIWL